MNHKPQLVWAKLKRIMQVKRRGLPPNMEIFFEIGY
jgi:hypothetical protein